jgi:hypothetical protein
LPIWVYLSAYYCLFTSIDHEPAQMSQNEYE